jgi:hypothetical protein
MMTRRVPLRSLIALLALQTVALAQPAAPVAAPIAAPIAAAPVAAPTELPVTRAVLFASGVGYFEHTGTVEDNANVRLLFKTEQINDVLKSMVVMDDGGGSVSTVTYPSNDPLERSLRSFGVNLSGNPTLPALLTQLRGAEITVSAPDKITGKILNVEARNRITGQPPTTIVEWNLTLVTDTGIRTIPMDSVQSLEFSDAKLRDEMNKALSTLVAARDVDRKPVEVRFDGKGKRKVRVGYLVETPVWKTSYRLDLSGEKPFLQGWSIVENASEADWQNVRLSLVSGRPISFTMDLYTPLYAPRPVVVPELFASLRPRVYDESNFVAKDKELASGGEKRAVAKSMMMREQMSTQNVTGRDMRSRMDAPASPMASAAPAEFDGDGPVGQIALGGSGTRSVASGGNLGELFSYTIASPVDLTRRRSAMLPIINQNIAAEKVSIFNMSVLQRNPLNGVLTNDTKLKMLAGPVTVFDGGAYAGDAQVDHLSPGDKRLLGYAVDLSVLADPSESSSSTITSGRLYRGVLYVNRKNIFEQKYQFRSKSDVNKVVIVEHPVRSERKLIEPAKPEEKTPTVYRFRTALDAGKTQTLVVKEEQVTSEGIAILPQSPDSLMWYTQTSEISPKVRDALAKAIAIKNEVAALERQLAEATNERKNISADQERLRPNINTAGRDSTLGKRYLAKLNEQETRIEELDKQIDATTKLLEAKRTELGNYLEKLDVN